MNYVLDTINAQDRTRSSSSWKVYECPCIRYWRSSSWTLFMLDVVAVSTKALAWEGNDGIQRRLHDKDNNDVGSKGVFLSHHHSIVT
ncbi:hypothetical protein P692DRAFT_2034512 [Suillus brevipes Sb2]|nr:hypothetical protein P692DRAFT_2034512 [Suillus brevipes Sb2]